MTEAADVLVLVIVRPTVSATDALNRVEELLGSDSVVKQWIRAAHGWPGFASLCNRFDSATDEETLLDHVTELRYGLVLTGLGFSVEYEPHGRFGPDLAISRDGLSAEIEITRFRPIHAGPPAVSEVGTLSTYGNPNRDIRKAMRKISRKFKQSNSELALIAIWNDDGDLEDLEVELATKALRSADDLPMGLKAVIYASDWVFRGYSIGHPDDQVLKWIHELESTTIASAIQKAIS